MKINPLLTLFEVVGRPLLDHRGNPCLIGNSYYPGPGTKEVLCPACRRPGVRISTDYRGSCVIFGDDVCGFPDHIGGLHHLFSEKVIRDLAAAGIRGFTAHPLVISRVECPRLLRVTPPSYYILEVTGSVAIDRQLYDENEGLVCPGCHNLSPKLGGKYTWGDKVVIPKIETWDGSGFVRLSDFNTATLYCSIEVVNLAIAKKWTGFGVQAFTSRFPKPDICEPNWFEKHQKEVKERFPNL